MTCDPVPATLTFEMTDAMMTRATREACIARARSQVRLRDLLLLACSTGIFAVAVNGEGHWLWWLSGVPALLASIAAALWAFFLWRLPKKAPERLGRLGHRRVEVGLGEARLAFRTANETLEVTWAEVGEIRQLPGFWAFCLRSGAEIPVPRALLPDESVAALRARAAAAVR